MDQQPQRNYLDIWPDEKIDIDLKELAHHWRTVGHSKRLFSSATTPTIAEVRTQLGLYAIGRDEKFFKKVSKKLWELRKDCLTYLTSKIRNQIIEKMNKLVVNSMFTDMYHLKHWYRQFGGTEDNLARMWMAIYGQFGSPEMRLFMKRISDEYMNLKGLKYIDDEDLTGLPGREKVGCYEGLASHAKSVIVKGINDVGSRSHGWRLKMQRIEEEMDEKTRYHRRKYDNTLGAFAMQIIGGKKVFLNNPNTILHNHIDRRDGVNNQINESETKDNDVEEVKPKADEEKEKQADKEWDDAVETRIQAEKKVESLTRIFLLFFFI